MLPGCKQALPPAPGLPSAAVTVAVWALDVVLRESLSTAHLCQQTMLVAFSYTSAGMPAAACVALRPSSVFVSQAVMRVTMTVMVTHITV